MLTDIEQWLKTLSISPKLQTASDAEDDEPDTLAKILHHQDEIKKLKDKEKTLLAIKAKCENLVDHADVSPLTKALLEQLLLTIEVIRKQITISNEQIRILLLHLQRLREKSPALSESTIGSSPMPEHEEEPKYIHVEQQTSFPLEKAPADTVEISVQTTKEKKPTENILVTQTVSEGHETIKFESTPNPSVPEQTEDVYVDAKYQQPNDPKKMTELILRNVPPTSFETKFVEPDDTTTEVVVDENGTKRIIVRKVTRTLKQQQIVHQQQQQQFTTIQSVVGEGDEPIEQSVSQVNLERQSTTYTTHDDGGSKTVSASQSRTSIATGESPDKLIVQEVIEHAPQVTEYSSNLLQQIQPGQTIQTTTLPTGIEQSSIQTVVQHVTQRVIRRRKQIIRRVVIIDGKEHVTEEIVELPDEVEITESETPNINVNIIQSQTIVSNEPKVELPGDDVQQIQKVCETPISEIEPIAVTKTKRTHIDSDKGKKKRDQKQVKDDKEKDSQVLDLESAPVELVVVENAPIVADLSITSVDVDVTKIELPADQKEIIVVKEPQSSEVIVEQTIITEESPVENIEEIWPPNAPSDSPPPSHDVSQSISIQSERSIEPEQEDSIKSQEIWPIDEKTGTPVVLDEYKFEKGIPETSTIENVRKENVQITKTIEIITEKPATPVQSIEIVEISQKSTPETEEEKEEPSERSEKSSGTFVVESDVTPKSQEQPSSAKEDKKSKKKQKKKKSKDLPDQRDVTSEFLAGERYDVDTKPVESTAIVQVDVIETKTPLESEKIEIKTTQEVLIDETKKLIAEEQPQQKSESIEIDVQKDQTPPSPKEEDVISEEKPSTDESKKSKKSSPKIVQIEITKKTEYIQPAIETSETIVETHTPEIIQETQTIEIQEPKPVGKTETVIETVETLPVEEQIIDDKPSSVEIQRVIETKTVEPQTQVKETVQTPIETVQTVESVSETIEITPIETKEQIAEDVKPMSIDKVQTVIETKVVEPIIVIDKPETPSKSPSETKTQTEEEKEQLKPSIDVRSATKLFIENELCTSDATTRTVKVSLPSKQSQSPGSVQVTMKVDSDTEQPKLNVNITEESIVVGDRSDSSKRNRKKKKRKEKTPTPEPSIDPSVAKSIELDVEDDDTISEKMEMPEIETTPVPKQIECVISPDGTYKSISSLEGAVKVIEESVIPLDSPSPKLLPTEIIIATDICEEQQIEDAEQQTSPVQFGDQQIDEKPQKAAVDVDSRSVQTSPDVKQQPATDVSQQTSPIPKADQVEQENQTEIEITTVEIQTSPISFGDEQQVRAPVEQVTAEIQTDVAPISETFVQTTDVLVKEQEIQTTPRDEDKQQTVIASDVVPKVAGKLVSDIIQKIPVKIPTGTVDTQTEMDTQIAQVPGESQSQSEPYEIHIQTSFIIPESLEIDSQRPDQQSVIEITKSFVIEEGKPPVVHEITATTSDDKDDKHPKKKSKKNKKGKKTTDEVDKAFLAKEKSEIVPQKDLQEIEKSKSSQQVELEITKTQEIYEPVLLPDQSTTEIVATVPQREIESTSQTVPVEIIESQPSTPKKPTLVTIDITRTTVYDTFNVSTDQGDVEEKSNVSEKVSIQKKIKPQTATSSVTIEEVLSPSEDDDVPVTPGLDKSEQYERAPDSIWSDTLKQAAKSKPQTPIESTSLANDQPQNDQQWQQTNYTINYRINNINNARKAHLSNVLHLASLSEPVSTPESVAKRAQTVQDNLNKLDEATKTRNSLIIHTTVINTIEEISTWLETIEYRVYLNRQNSNEGPSDDKIEEFDNLIGELQNIDENVKHLSENLNAVNDLVDPVEKERMSECLENLQKQLDAVEEVTKESGDEVQSDMKRWNQYITIVETITTTITELQKRLETIQTEDTPIPSRLSQLDDLENKNRDQISDIANGLQTARGLSRDFPSKPFPIDIYATYENARQLENSLAMERGRLLQLQSLTSLYNFIFLLLTKIYLVYFCLLINFRIITTNYSKIYPNLFVIFIICRGGGLYLFVLSQYENLIFKNIFFLF